MDRATRIIACIKAGRVSRDLTALAAMAGDRDARIVLGWPKRSKPRLRSIAKLMFRTQWTCDLWHQVLMNMLGATYFAQYLARSTQLVEENDVPVNIGFTARGVRHEPAARRTPPHGIWSIDEHRMTLHLAARLALTGWYRREPMVNTDDGWVVPMNQIPKHWRIGKEMLKECLEAFLDRIGDRRQVTVQNVAGDEAIPAKEDA